PGRTPVVRTRRSRRCGADLGGTLSAIARGVSIHGASKARGTAPAAGVAAGFSLRQSQHTESFGRRSSPLRPGRFEFSKYEYTGGLRARSAAVGTILPLR